MAHYWTAATEPPGRLALVIIALPLTSDDESRLSVRTRPCAQTCDMTSTGARVSAPSGF